jgi:hypothetical protein
MFATAARLRLDRSELPDVAATTMATVSRPPDLVGAFGGPRGHTAWEWHSHILREMHEPGLRVTSRGDVVNQEAHRFLAQLMLT